MMTAEQLKASILQMAMQGKLVEQRKIEGTGEALFQIIQNEKKQLIAQRKIKQGKKTPEITADEVPFEIPNNWKWVRWGELSESIQYGVNAPAKEVGRIRMVRISDIQDGKVQWETVPFCDVSEESIADYLLKRNDILFARTGGTVGKSYIVKELPEEAVYAGYLIRTRYSDHLEPMYLKYFMESDLYWSQLRSGTIATAQPNCNGQTLSKMILPLPPLEEQKRIVAKIEELMPFVEQYAKASTRLNTLNAAFPEQMKKSILQQAVMGKLVPQDPNDEPASVLLKKIAEEKQKLIKEGKIKKQEALPAITEDEIPFDIPESWEWVQLDELVIFENGDRGKNYPNKSEYVQSGVAWINTGHIKPNGYLTTSEMNYITREKFESLRSGKIEANDLVFCLRGATYGKVSRVEPYTEGAVASSLMIIRPIISILRDYLLLYLKTPLAFSELTKYANGSAQPNLGAKDVRKYLVPLPPLKEQKRILECVEEILPKLDDLHK